MQVNVSAGLAFFMHIFHLELARRKRPARARFDISARPLNHVGVQRWAAILLLLVYAGLGSGALEFIHNSQHLMEAARQIPPPSHLTPPLPHPPPHPDSHYPVP